MADPRRGCGANPTRHALLGQDAPRRPATWRFKPAARRGRRRMHRGRLWRQRRAEGGLQPGAPAQEAAILILDEPTASLDFGNPLRVPQEVYASKRQGLAPSGCLPASPNTPCASGFEEFARKMAFAIGGLTDEERARLKAWFEADPERGRRGGTPFRWALIGWEK